MLRLSLPFLGIYWCGVLVDLGIRLTGAATSPTDSSSYACVIASGYQTLPFSFYSVRMMYIYYNQLKWHRDVQVLVTEGGRKVPLLKSDGTTLYLSRDVAAALDRWVTYRFDRMLYVVDNSQHQHFAALKEVLQRLGYDWADRVEHVKFGRIQSMSTRKGNVVFLHNVLDEAKQKMMKKQQQSISNSISLVLSFSKILSYKDLQF